MCAGLAKHTPCLQVAVDVTSVAFEAAQIVKAAYAFCLVLSLFEAMHAIPSVAMITSALTQSLVPLLELALVSGAVSVLLAMMILIEAPTAESLTTPPLLLSYMLNGLITGAVSLSRVRP